VAAGSSLVFEPGGLHLMLLDVDRLEVGDIVVVTLNWQTAGDMEIEAEVVDPAETLEHDDHEG
jgi:copper(I)-binding protein